MTLRIAEVRKEDLPETATQGFRILDGDQALLFFHWHEQGEIEIPSRQLNPLEPAPVTTRHVTSFADVLKALPDRLKALGHEADITAIQTEVLQRYGVKS